jgi:hypothetical protein
MKSVRRLVPFVFLCILCALPSFASVPVRGSSNNGVDNSAFNWNLYGPTAPISRHGGTVTLQTQVVCTNQQVAATVFGNTDNTTAGTCLQNDDNPNNYTFLFQIQSAATNLTVTISNLVGFSADTNLPTYGIAVCDNDINNPDGSNTLQLCTQVSGLDLSNINATVNKKSAKITFTVPSIPAFPPGIGKQGQGLTFVILEKQNGPTIAVPRISFK